jgi:transcriptional regulator with XRE-family HTH domain
MTIFSDRMTELMEKRNLTQKELSEKAGVTQSAMSYYSRGDRTPRSDVLSRIAEALNTSTDYLLGNTTHAFNDANSEKLQYLQRKLGKLNEKQLIKAEKLLEVAFDEIFEEEEEDF